MNQSSETLSNSRFFGDKKKRVSTDLVKLGWDKVSSQHVEWGSIPNKQKLLNKDLKFSTYEKHDKKKELATTQPPVNWGMWHWESIFGLYKIHYAMNDAKCTMKAFDGHQRFVSEGEKKNNIHQKKCYWIKSWSSKISKTRPRVDVIFGRRIFAGKAGHWWSETYLSAKTSKKNWRNKNSDKLPPNALKLQVPFPLKIPTEYYMPFSEVFLGT